MVWDSEMHGSSFLWQICYLASVWRLWKGREVFIKDESLSPYILILKINNILWESVANQHSLANWTILKGWLPSSLTLITQRIGMTWTSILGEFSPLSQPWYQWSQCCSASFLVTSSYTSFLYLLKCHPPWETSINLSFSFPVLFPFPESGNKDI